MKKTKSLAKIIAGVGISGKVLEAYLEQPALVAQQPVAKNNEIILYGPIVDEGLRSFMESWFNDKSCVSATSFKKALNDITGDVTVRINSPGGDVDEAAAINSLLRDRGKTNVRIDGLCASAATFLLMNCNEIVAGEFARVMIHDSGTCVCGNKQDLRKVADLLEKVDGQISNFYAKRMDMDVKDIKKMMSEETELTAEEAFDAGLVDKVADGEDDEETKQDMKVTALSDKDDENRLVLAKAKAKAMAVLVELNKPQTEEIATACQH